MSHFTLHLPLLQWTPMYFTVQLKNSGWVFMYLCTYLCMNDCTLPVHLNSILHITSTLIWAIKCAVDLCIFVIFDAVDRFANQSINFICVVTTTERILNGGKKTSTKLRWSAFYDDGNRWKCFTTHFHPSAVINKTALNCMYVQLFFQFQNVIEYTGKDKM